MLLVTLDRPETGTLNQLLIGRARLVVHSSALALVKLSVSELPDRVMPVKAGRPGDASPALNAASCVTNEAPLEAVKVAE